MITFDTFSLGLMIVSVATGLVTEGIKKLLADANRTCHANILASIVSIVLSMSVGIGYIIFNNLGFTPQIIISLIALAGLSWLCAMVGYDKVREAFNFKSTKGE